MRTWIDGVPCAVVKRDAFSTDGRFSLDCEALYVFSSQKSSMMPGDILLRTIRIEFGESNDDKVKVCDFWTLVLPFFVVKLLLLSDVRI